MPKTNGKTERSPIQKKTKIMEKLRSADIRTGEKLLSLTVLDIAQLPGVTNDDVLTMLEIQKRTRDGTLFDFFCED